MSSIPRYNRARWRALLRRVHSALGSPRAWLLAAAIALVVVAIASTALARPGGGHGFSGGGGGGGGDGDGLFMLFIILLQLCFEYPAIGVPLMIIFLIVVAVMGLMRMRRHGYKDWESGVPNVAPAQAYSPAASVQRPHPQAPGGFGAPQQGIGISARGTLDAIRSFDQNFSTVLFEDFLYALFAEVHRARGGNKLERLSAYLGQDARNALSQRAVLEVSSVIVGAVRVLSVSGVSPSDAFVHVGVEFEANYTERWPSSNAPQGAYVVEQWYLVRRHGALSRTPDRAQVIGCPSCGAPLEVVIAGHCSYCQQHVNTGAFDWVVQGIQLVRREARGPMLTADVAEEGTHLPTIVEPHAHAAIQALMARDPQFRWESFQAKIGLIFSEFQTAWSGRDLAKMRPFLSDSLFQTQQYWVETYRQQRLRNVTDRARIVGLELAKVGTDRFYDSITVRLYATGLDYTVSDDGNRVVSGSTSRERAYSEYWTLVRGSGRSAPVKADKACPNCGAPLQINMAGHCEYCKAKVTSGQFDWVLSKIEQDEVYGGGVASTGALVAGQYLS